MAKSMEFTLVTELRYSVSGPDGAPVFPPHIPAIRCRAEEMIRYRMQDGHEKGDIVMHIGPEEMRYTATWAVTKTRTPA